LGNKSLTQRSNCHRMGNSGNKWENKYTDLGHRSGTDKMQKPKRKKIKVINKSKLVTLKICFV